MAIILLTRKLLSSVVNILHVGRFDAPACWSWCVLFFLAPTPTRKRIEEKHLHILVHILTTEDSSFLVMAIVAETCSEVLKLTSFVTRGGTRKTVNNRRSMGNDNERKENATDYSVTSASSLERAHLFLGHIKCHICKLINE
jgi:hypothetical protein